MGFDYEGAKKAGYNDEEITQFATQAMPSVDIKGAIGAGYSLQEIMDKAQQLKTEPQDVSKAPEGSASLGGGPAQAEAKDAQDVVSQIPEGVKDVVREDVVKPAMIAGGMSIGGIGGAIAGGGANPVTGSYGAMGGYIAANQLYRMMNAARENKSNLEQLPKDIKDSILMEITGNILPVISESFAGSGLQDEAKNLGIKLLSKATGPSVKNIEKYIENPKDVMDPSALAKQYEDKIALANAEKESSMGGINTRYDADISKAQDEQRLIQQQKAEENAMSLEQNRFDVADTKQAALDYKNKLLDTKKTSNMKEIQKAEEDIVTSKKNEVIQKGLRDYQHQVGQAIEDTLKDPSLPNVDMTDAAKQFDDIAAKNMASYNRTKNDAYKTAAENVLALKQERFKGGMEQTPLGAWEIQQLLNVDAKGIYNEVSRIPEKTPASGSAALAAQKINDQIKAVAGHKKDFVELLKTRDEADTLIASPEKMLNTIRRLPDNPAQREIIKKVDEITKQNIMGEAEKLNNLYAQKQIELDALETAQTNNISLMSRKEQSALKANIRQSSRELSDLKNQHNKVIDDLKNSQKNELETIQKQHNDNLDQIQQQQELELKPILDANKEMGPNAPTKSSFIKRLVGVGFGVPFGIAIRHPVAGVMTGVEGANQVGSPAMARFVVDKFKGIDTELMSQYLKAITAHGIIEKTSPYRKISREK